MSILLEFMGYHSYDKFQEAMDGAPTEAKKKVIDKIVGDNQSKLSRWNHTQLKDLQKEADALNYRKDEVASHVAANW
jgi:hypothetical protein